MRRLVISVVAALLALGTVASIASATHSNGEGPDKDFTNASTKGPTGTPLGTFPSKGHVNASTDPGSPLCANNGTCGNLSLRLYTPPSPQNPTGEVVATGDVTCLNAYNGDNSVLGAVITSQEGQFGPFPSGALVGWRILARNTDNGEGSNDPPDASGGSLIPPGPAFTVCPPIPFPTLPQPQGNITVHDGI
jgi:hypothetical protein